MTVTLVAAAAFVIGLVIGRASERQAQWQDPDLVPRMRALWKRKAEV